MTTKNLKSSTPGQDGTAELMPVCPRCVNNKKIIHNGDLYFCLGCGGRYTAYPTGTGTLTLVAK